VKIKEDKEKKERKGQRYKIRVRCPHVLSKDKEACRDNSNTSSKDTSRTVQMAWAFSTR
jgi:hypothetical protein